MDPNELAPEVMNRERIAASLDFEHKKLTEQFELLISSIDAEYVFQTVVANFLLAHNSVQDHQSSIQTPAFVELAAYYLFPRFGIGGSREPKLIQDFFDMLEEMNMSRALATANETNQSDRQIAMLQLHLLLEADLVRGSAYAPLLRKRIVGIQCPFEDWFKYIVGIGPCRALEVIDAYLKAINANLTQEQQKLKIIYSDMAQIASDLRKRKADASREEEVDRQKADIGERLTDFYNNAVLNLAPSFSQIKILVPELSQDEWRSLRDLIGLTADSRKALSNPREMRDRPLYWLPSDRILYLDVSCVYDALFEAYDAVTRLKANQPFRDSRYIIGLSEWMEKEVPQYFRRVFPKHSVFNSL